MAIKGSLAEGTLKQSPPAGGGGVNHVKVLGKNILGRKRSELEGGNEFGMSVGQSEDRWLEVTLEDSVPELSGMNDPPLLFSKVKLVSSQSDTRQPCGGVLNRMS